ncbi:MAG: 4-hydroxythreonine-4-phosphate dehydrogenase PdxA [Verrucomicrobiia bacterium]
MKPRIAVTMGDPAGIGPEICLDLLRDESVRQVAVPLVFGDVTVLREAAEKTGKPGPEQVLGWERWKAEGRMMTEPGVVDLGAMEGNKVVPGRVDAATGRASFRYVEAAIEAAMEGWVAGVATGPIHKQAWHAAGVPYPGHTEIFATRTRAKRSCMMLTSEKITCSFVTSHVGYREVPDLLSVARILEVMELTDEAMRRLRGRKPRLVVNGLNPHAGEGGLFGGMEEERFIVPAVEEARERGMEVVGPLPPDTAFLGRWLAETDAYICMYHDQGLIPLKMLAFDSAINTTLGLPIIRTSVDHGTALDLAWQGRAMASSLCRAVEMAARLAEQG